MRASRRMDDPIGSLCPQSLRGIMRRMSFALTLAVAFLAQAPASPTPSPSPAATPAHISDPCTTIIAIVTRPTITTSACTVRPNHVLIENGYTNTVTTGTGGGVTASYPQPFIRIGTTIPHLELAFTPPSDNRSTVGGPLFEGTSDINFGLKYEIGYTAKAVWGVNAQVSAPTGSPPFTSGGTQYTGNINWTYSLSPVFGLAGTFGFNSFTGFAAPGQVQRFSSFIPSLTVTAALPANSELFAEYVYFSHAGLNLPGKSLIDGGLIHDFGPNVQVDAEYGFSPTLINGQRQHYVGAGLSFML